mgnify:CR=1 FL=1
MTPTPPSEPAPPVPLAPPAERVTWRCPTCGQPRRFVSAHRPMLAGLWVHCEGCRTALGLYVVDDNGNTLLRLACV